MGFINYRLEKEWICEIGKQQNMRFTMVGPIEKMDVSIFKEYKNIRFQDTLYGEELFDFLVAQHVLVIPFDINHPRIQAITISNKFYQYLATGRPIVISNMPNFMEFPSGIIYRAKNKKEFVDKIRQAIEEDCTELVRKRLVIARQNHWDIRGNYLHQLIENELLSKERYATSNC